MLQEVDWIQVAVWTAAALLLVGIFFYARKTKKGK